ncbi:MAG: hypothetical protein H0U52_05295 [Chloroflexi bacterium]|nr:hypothetical protein [Chloroflexota bacterium]
MPSRLNTFERELIATLLAPDHPVTNALRRQSTNCQAARRKFTGHGFFTTLVVSKKVAAAPVRPGRLALGDVTATIEGLEHGAGFLLFIADGVLQVLEGFAYDEPWPVRVEQYRVSAGGVSHGSGSQTDIEQIKAASLPSE